MQWVLKTLRLRFRLFFYAVMIDNTEQIVSSTIKKLFVTHIAGMARKKLVKAMGDGYYVVIPCSMLVLPRIHQTQLTLK